MAAPKQIEELVERFERNVEAYKSGRYNETQLRREFIDPFFAALGWDVENRGGRLGLQREVIHEDSVFVRESTKNPDYGFYVGQARKFFVEAKKPSVNLENDVKAAFQLRSYAWSAGLPISLLTDFEEFSIYDCRIEPSNSDSPRVGLLRHFTYDKYIDHWDEIAALFSREAVLGGSLERYIESKKKARGTIAVDEAFLREIDHWREILAKNVHRSNPDLTVRELNSSVQNTIDRIVFLRICEDRGIEKFGQLKDQLTGEMTIYAKLVELFRQADEKYNSGLFHFKEESGRGEPDRLTPSLKIDDAVLSEMIESLYPPKSPYRFAVIPAEILGHVYEQFLGKVISLGEGGEVEVEYKPEVRKAGGVYYTPTYIVDYIVENTVGKLLEGETPTAVSGLRILDPACGSGSFLIGAYQRLLDWHLGWYADHLVPLLEAGTPETSKDVRTLLPESYTATTANTGAGAGGAGDGRRRGRGRPRKSSMRASATQAGQFPIFQASGGEWRLTTAERKRILLNNIYGVDIDLQATEVTKLSLQLKVLEGENQETLSRQLTLFHDRALPDLGENIKCGNSLIGPDFYDRQTSLFDEEEMYRVNAFDWEAEFPEIMGRGGFDAVIGNPPYVRTLYFSEDKEYYNTKYYSAFGSYDIYILFMDRSLNLIRSNGIVGLITPNKFFVADYGAKIRKLLLHNASIIEIADLGKCKSVFADALISTAITVYSKSSTSDSIRLKILNDENVKQISDVPSRDVPNEEIITSSGLIRVYQDPISNAMFNKISKQSQPLASVAQVRSGVMGFDYWAMDKCIDDNNNGRRIATNSYIDRYKFLWGKKVNLYKKTFFNPRLSPKCDAVNANTLELFASPKIVVRGVARRLTAMLDDEGVGILVAVHSVRGERYTNQFLIGLLNSTLFDYIHKTKFYSARIPQGSLRYPVSFLADLPIRTIDFSDPQDVARHDSMVKLVENMLDLHRRWRRRRPATRRPSSRARSRRPIGRSTVSSTSFTG